MSSYTNLKKHIDKYGVSETMSDIDYYLEVGGDEDSFIGEPPVVHNVSRTINKLDKIRQKLVDYIDSETI